MTQMANPHRINLSTALGNNEKLAQKALQEALNVGVTEFCFCPASRNTPFLYVLEQNPQVKVHFFFEERCAAYFAVGRSVATQKPVGVIVTSGTATTELFPAAMHSHYAGIPVLLITADRPIRYRGKGAPQSAEHKNLYGNYVSFELDVVDGGSCDLTNWRQTSACHMNVCFEEPSRKSPTQLYKLEIPKEKFDFTVPSHYLLDIDYDSCKTDLDAFFQSVKRPMVVVGTLKEKDREAVVQFLLKLKLPVLLEGISGLREDPRLQYLRIYRIDGILKNAEKYQYPIDGVIRIGGLPTCRLWRDLDELDGEVKACTISELPFSGLSWSISHPVNISSFLNKYPLNKNYTHSNHFEWLAYEQEFAKKLNILLMEEFRSEPGLIYHLSEKLKNDSLVFLGNSLPIREWDLAATQRQKNLNIKASRGINGIDGQISTFLGLCSSKENNWAIIGDLTALYDLAGPWILSQLKDIIANIVIVNNGGGKIFKRMYENPVIQNLHSIQFEPFAKLWNLNYQRWEEIPNSIESNATQIIEIIPDEQSTERFWKKMETI